MKIQDPLTQLLATKLSPTQLKLVNAFLRQQVSDYTLESAGNTLRHAFYRRKHALEDTCTENGEVIEAEAAVTAAEQQLSRLYSKRDAAVRAVTDPLWKRLETILNDARTGKLTTEQFKEAVDAFCKETDAT